MTFSILKIVALGLVGWVLYRSFGNVSESGEESGTDSPGKDLDGEPAGAIDAQAEPAGATDGQTEPAGATDAQTEPAGATDAQTEPEAVPAQALSKVRGIGPTIETLLNAGGIETWAQLATTEVSALQAILEEAGPRYRVHDPSTWPAQAAELAQAN